MSQACNCRCAGARAAWCGRLLHWHSLIQRAHVFLYLYSLYVTQSYSAVVGYRGGEGEEKEREEEELDREEKKEAKEKKKGNVFGEGEHSAL